MKDYLLTDEEKNKLIKFNECLYYFLSSKNMNVYDLAFYSISSKFTKEEVNELLEKAGITNEIGQQLLDKFKKPFFSLLMPREALVDDGPFYNSLPEEMKKNYFEVEGIKKLHVLEKLYLYSDGENIVTRIILYNNPAYNLFSFEDFNDPKQLPAIRATLDINGSPFLCYDDVCLLNYFSAFFLFVENITPTKTERRTQKKAIEAGAIDFLPDKLALISARPYQNSLSFYRKGNAFLLPPVKSDTEIVNGKISNFEFLTESNIKDIFTEEKITEIDTAFLQPFYSGIKELYDSTKILSDVYSLYFPMVYSTTHGGRRNVKQDDIDNFIRKIKEYDRLVGAFPRSDGGPGFSYYPLLVFIEYDAETNILRFASPYMNYIIRKLTDYEIKTDKKGNPRITAGEIRKRPTHTRLVHADIVSEKNKDAVSFVYRIVVLIEQAGNGKPNIKISTLIKENPQFEYRLKNSKNQRQLLKRTFTKVWDLLRTKTDLTEVYKNIELPTPDKKGVYPPELIPTMSSLDTVITFKHDGKIDTSKIKAADMKDQGSQP